MDFPEALPIHTVSTKWKTLASEDQIYPKLCKAPGLANYWESLPTHQVGAPWWPSLDSRHLRAQNLEAG